MELFKLEDDEDTMRLRYLFFRNNGYSFDSKWMLNYKRRCNNLRTKPIEKGDLSDYEYFKLLHPPYNDDSNTSRYFLVDKTAVANCILKKNSLGIVDVTITTAKNYQHKGYATSCLMMVEELLFRDNTIKGIRLLDASSHHEATSKMAIKLNYQEQGLNSNIYIKYNPNYSDDIHHHL